MKSTPYVNDTAVQDLQDNVFDYLKRLRYAANRQFLPLCIGSHYLMYSFLFPFSVFIHFAQSDNVHRKNACNKVAFVYSS